MWPFGRKDDHRSAAFNVAIELERWAEMHTIERETVKLRMEHGADAQAVQRIDRMTLRYEALETLDGLSEHE
jgi:hypothetical protein